MAPNLAKTDVTMSAIQPLPFGTKAQRRIRDAGQTEAHDIRLDLLCEVGKRVGKVSELTELVEQITHMTQRAFNASASSVLLLDEEKQELFFEVAEGRVGKAVKQMRLRAQSGIAGWVVCQGKPLIVNDVAEDRRFDRDVDESTGFVTRSVMCAPMVVHCKIVGAIEVLNKLDGSDFTEQDLETLVSVASTAAMAIEGKRTEENLRESEERYRSLVNNTDDLVFSVDLEGYIIFANSAARKFTGCESEEIIGHSFAEYVHPDDAAAMLAAVEQVLCEQPLQSIQGVGQEMEFRMIKKDGEVILATAKSLPVKDGQGKILGFSGIARDITERRNVEEEKQRMEGQLQIAGRLAAVGELAAGIAHELSNPLAAVQGFSQFLAQRDDLDKTVKLDVETIYQESQRATKIVNSLLSIAYRHDPEKRLISITEALEKSLEIHAYQMKVNNIELTKEFEHDVPMTMADLYQMQHVFVNIINNAEQAMTEAHGRGRLIVKVQRFDEMIRVTFTDDGPGISKANVERIFDPFFTTKDEGKGTGLGLSICFGIIQEHGGHLYAKSEPDNGATFVIEIPILSEPRPIAEGIDNCLNRF